MVMVNLSMVMVNPRKESMPKQGNKMLLPVQLVGKKLETKTARKHQAETAKVRTKCWPKIA